MSNKEKHWYQDGGTVFSIIVALTLLTILGSRFWQQEKEQQKAPAIALNAGRLDISPDGEPILHLRFWHVHPGVLRNGRLTVIVDYPGTRSGEGLRIHAFDIWEPNQDHTVAWDVPLPGYDLEQRVPVRVRLEAENARTLVYTQVWLGTGWVEDEVSISE